jgi:hypothetical protein
VTPVLSADEVNAAGMVPCARRMGDLIARDRCVEHQAEGCTCQLAQVVRAAVRQNRELEKQRARRAPKTVRPAPKRHLLVVYPPWELKCQWCGTVFQHERGRHRKPDYCSSGCHAKGAARNKAIRLAARAAPR